MRRNPYYDGRYAPMPPQRPAVRQPEESAPKHKRFFWWLFGVPLLLVIVAWISQPLKPAVNWVEVMEMLRVPQGSRERYTQLAMLGVFICSGLAAYRIIAKR